MSVLRGCGYRQKGGLYIEVKLSEGGLPIEFFVLDPPQPVDVHAIGLSPIGQQIIHDPQGVAHVLDWVGEANYPNVQDFIEETRRHGVSRRISTRFDVSALSERSKILLVHRKAIITNAADYYLGRLDDTRRDPDCEACEADGCWGHLIEFSEQCRSHRAEGPRSSLEDRVQRAAVARFHGYEEADARIETCSDLWKDDIEGGGPPMPAMNMDGSEQPPDDRRTLRKIGDTAYTGRRRPEHVLQSHYSPGIFLALPISNLAVISDPDRPEKIADLYEQVSSRLNGLDVVVEDQ